MRTGSIGSSAFSLLTVENKLKLNKMKRIKSLITTNLGRYLLSAILIIVGGILSPYSTIINGWEFFTYVMGIGLVIMVGQFIYHIIMAIYLNVKK